MLWRLPHPPSVALRDWLKETGSLTKRLRAVYGASFSVQVLQNHWQAAFTEECQTLALHHGQYHLIREVQLQNQQQAVVLARTILPQATLAIAHRHLAHLGERPLGEVIFAYPDLQRLDRRYCYLQPSVWSPAIRSQLTVDQPVWGRRTVYAIHGQPMLVAEFFLPALRGIL